jgi:methyl-accepting chemotaxis protein
MKIKTRLILIIILFFSSISIFGGTTFFINKTSVTLEQKEKHIDELVLSVFERNLFFNDYLLTSTERAKQQLMSRHADVGEHINELLSILDNKKEIEQVTYLRDVNYITITSDIERFLAGTEEVEEAEEKTMINEHLISNIAIKSLSTAQIAKQLGKTYQKELENLRTLLTTALVIFVFIGLVSVLGIMGIVFSIIRGITKLQKGAQEITSGNLQHRVSIQTRDELGVLGEMFNDMANTLSISYGKIEESKKLLEDRVREQTKVLTEKVALLEQFKTITEEREHKMIELKKRMSAIDSKEKK